MSDWWAEAGREFMRRLELRERVPKGRDAVDWRYLNCLALDEDNLAPVLVGMGFICRLGCWERGVLAGWPATDGPVFLMLHRNDASYLIDTGSGRWRAVDNAQRGRDLVSLGAMLWRCRYGVAGWRIVKLCGHDRFPLRKAR